MNAIQAKIVKFIPAHIRVSDGAVRLISKELIPGAKIVSIEEKNGGRTFQVVPDLNRDNLAFSC